MIHSMTILSRVLGFIAFLASGPSTAQRADTLVWEPIGDIQQATWLDFNDDAVYAGTSRISDQAGSLGIAVLYPDSTEWLRAFNHSLRADDFVFFNDSLVFGLWHRFLYRSTDSGNSFSEADQFEGARSLPIRAPDGNLVVGYDSAIRPAARSEDDGATWTVPDGPDLALTPIVLVVIPPTADLPEGRVIGAGYGGIGYSDDNGRTWAPTVFSGGGGLAFSAWAAVRISQGPQDGDHGGAVLAVVEGNGSIGPTIMRSEDGAVWEPVAPSPSGSGYSARLVAGPDGAVYFYDITETENRMGRPVWRSVDGGSTWDNIGPIWTAWRAVPTDIDVGPDGHLWASAEGRWVLPGIRVGGVFRTASPVLAVTRGEDPLGSKSLLSLRAFPNPTHDLVTAELSSSTPLHVRLSVFDVMGREVAIMHEGSHRGRLRYETEIGALAPGHYLIRALSGEASVTAIVVVTD